MNSRQLMVADGAPKALFLTPAQRAKAWAGRPLTTVQFVQLKRDQTPEQREFAEQLKRDQTTALLNRLARAKARKQVAAIDYSKMRWDATRNKFVPQTGSRAEPTPDLVEQPRKTTKRLQTAIVKAMALLEWSCVNKDTAVALAKLNGVWDDKYAKLSGGLLVMTVTNRLKGLAKKGGEVKWI